MSETKRIPEAPRVIEAEASHPTESESLHVPEVNSHAPESEPTQGHVARNRMSRVPRTKHAWDKERSRELFRLYKEEGDAQARQQLIMSHMNLVRFLASKFRNRGEPLEDLISVGSLGLIKAIDRFDPSRGIEFTTFATPTITGEIKRHFRDKGWSVRIPRRLQELSAKIGPATDDLTRELQRSPTTEEVAQRLEVSVDEILEAMESAGAYSAVPLEGQSSEEDGALSVIERYGIADSDLVTIDDRMTLSSIMKDLSPREQEIISMRFVDDMTQVEIAERLDVSQVQVSRLLRKTLQKIRENLEDKN